MVAMGQVIAPMATQIMVAMGQVIATMVIPPMVVMGLLCIAMVITATVINKTYVGYRQLQAKKCNGWMGA